MRNQASPGHKVKVWNSAFYLCLEDELTVGNTDDVIFILYQNDLLFGQFCLLAIDGKNWKHWLSSYGQCDIDCVFYELRPLTWWLLTYVIYYCDVVHGLFFRLTITRKTLLAPSYLLSTSSKTFIEGRVFPSHYMKTICSWWHFAKKEKKSRQDTKVWRLFDVYSTIFVLKKKLRTGTAVLSQE